MAIQKREYWIDTLKAICIIRVYIAHCESFYCSNYNIAKLIVTPFYVNAFFFINGYLIVRKYFKTDKISDYSLKEYIHNIKNILFRLAIPTIIFSAIIYLPKNNFNFNLQNFSITVLGGVSLWFTSALCVSQFVIYTLFLSKQKNIWFYVFVTFSIFLSLYFWGDIKSKPAIEYFPWFWQTGLIYTFIMMLGGLYNVYESYNNNFLKNKVIKSVIFATVIIIIIMQWNGFEVYCLGLSGKCNILGITTIILSILLLIFVAKQIRPNKITDFIGRQSIIFYFLSGAVPSTLLVGIKRLPLENSYIILIVYVLLSLTISYLTAYIITKYIPFILDIRNIKKR